jgi:hypothetical protein
MIFLFKSGMLEIGLCHRNQNPQLFMRELLIDWLVLSSLKLHMVLKIQMEKNEIIVLFIVPLCSSLLSTELQVQRESHFSS